MSDDRDSVQYQRLRPIDYIWPFTGRVRQGKRAWREHVARIDALPPDYRLVLEEIQKFMWNFALDDSLMAVQEDLLELFEDAAADGRPVLTVTGDDVAGFALAVLQEAQARTWTGKKADQLNQRVRRRLAGPHSTPDDEGHDDD